MKLSGCGGTRVKLPVLPAIIFYLVWSWKQFRALTARLSQKFNILLRALGLGVLARIKGDEPPKVLIHQSRFSALSHCAVHLFPSAASFALISLNFQGRFIGATLQGVQLISDDVKLAAIQVAAKVHEILIVASLSTIIFHVMRSNLIHGHGVPLGLIGAGWSFSEATYFFSAEFWGGALSRSGSRPWSECLLIPLLVISGIIASFAGPATAVLATPKTSDWNVGGATIWLNGSQEQLWPTELDGTVLQGYNCSTTESRLYDPKCPSGGFPSLYQYFKTRWEYPDSPSQVEFDLQDYSMIKRLFAVNRIESAYNTHVYTAHWATAMVQDAKRGLYDLSLIWLRDSQPHAPPYPAYLDVAADMTYGVNGLAPLVETACVTNFSISITNETLETDWIVPFPTHSGDDWGFDIDSDPQGLSSPVPYFTKEVDLGNTTQQYLQDRGFVTTQLNGSIAVNNTTPAVVVVPIKLPVDSSTGNPELGFVILQRQADSTTFEVTSCTADTYWTNAQTQIVSQPEANRGRHEYTKGRVRNVVTTSLASFLVDGHSAFYYGNPIDIQTDWYDLMSPTLADSVSQGLEPSARYPSSTERTLMERLLETILYPLYDTPTTGLASVRSIELAVSSFLVDGLSRCGSTLQNNASAAVGWPTFNPSNNAMARSLVYKGSPKLQGASSKPAVFGNNDATEMVMKAVFNGYLLGMTSGFDYFAVVILLLHAFMALVYTIWVSWFGAVMEVIDNIPELVAIAQNSPPPDGDALGNTCAGIRSLRTLGSVAIMETARVTDKPAAREELVLRFTDKPRDITRIPQVEQEYGAIEDL